MKILMLGNSLTTANDMPQRLAELLMEKICMDASSMHERMQETFRQAVKENDAILANVGNVFHDWEYTKELYAQDGVHPSEAGSNLAAGVIADAILEYEDPGYAHFDGKTVRITDIDGNIFTGKCSWFSSGFGEAELGQAEEGLQIRRRVFFASTISKVEEV